MKKIFSVILMFTFMINIQAATAIKNYDETVDVTKEYINDFENNSKYIILKQEMNIPFIFKNGKVEYSNVFNGNGGLLNEEEYNIGKGYLYNGLNFWLVSDNSNYKIVGTKSDIENKNKTEEYGIRVTEFVKSTARVTGEGTRLNPWEFAKRQFEVQLKVENGIVDAVNMSEYIMFITEGDTDGTTVTGKAGYAFDSVSCTNSQNAEYENGKIRIKNIFANTECTVKFVNPGKTISYKEEEQTYDVKYSGYYEINAYGAQGNGNGGKGGHTYGKVYLEKGTKLIVNTGGQNGYNGGGSGYYSGGGSTTVKLFGGDLMIAAGGGGGKSGTAGGNGDSLGGASVGAGAGSDGTNRGGGGSGYNYTYADTYNDCKTGHNTCKDGMISKNCSACYDTTCVSGEKTECDDCASTTSECTGGYTSVCKTCTFQVKTCPDGQHFGTLASNSNTCYYDDLYVTGSCACKNGKGVTGSCTDVECYGKSGYERDRSADSYAGYGTYAEACTHYTNGTIRVTGICHFSSNWLGFDPVTTSKTEPNCSKCGSESVCKSWTTKCVRECNTVIDSCASVKCVYGCDPPEYDPCLSGEDTCEGGWEYATKPYNSGNGGSNLLSDKLEESKSESGKNVGNGKVVISYYGEKL